MVDVGYNINGKHGVIRNVWSCANSKTGDIQVTYTDNSGEVYVLRYEDVEYVIPHEEENTIVVGDKDGWYKSSYTEEKMIELCQKVDPPLTFADKFKEVFGFRPNNKNYSLCEIMDCNGRDGCQGCPYDCREWDDPYDSEVKNEC